MGIRRNKHEDEQGYGKEPDSSSHKSLAPQFQGIHAQASAVRCGAVLSENPGNHRLDAVAQCSGARFDVEISEYLRSFDYSGRGPPDFRRPLCRSPYERERQTSRSVEPIGCQRCQLVPLVPLIVVKSVKSVDCFTAAGELSPACLAAGPRGPRCGRRSCGCFASCPGSPIRRGGSRRSPVRSSRGPWCPDGSGSS